MGMLSLEACYEEDGIHVPSVNNEGCDPANAACLSIRVRVYNQHFFG